MRGWWLFTKMAVDWDWEKSHACVTYVYLSEARGNQFHVWIWLLQSEETRHTCSNARSCSPNFSNKRNNPRPIPENTHELQVMEKGPTPHPGKLRKPNTQRST
jgi:hypothetical protein